MLAAASRLWGDHLHVVDPHATHRLAGEVGVVLEADPEVSVDRFTGRDPVGVGVLAGRVAISVFSVSVWIAGCASYGSRASPSPLRSAYTRPNRARGDLRSTVLAERAPIPGLVGSRSSS